MHLGWKLEGIFTTHSKEPAKQINITWYIFKLITYTTTLWEAIVHCVFYKILVVFPIPIFCILIKQIKVKITWPWQNDNLVNFQPLQLPSALKQHRCYPLYLSKILVYISQPKVTHTKTSLQKQQLNSNFRIGIRFSNISAPSRFRTRHQDF